MEKKQPIKGRGAQQHPENPYHRQYRAVVHHEATDEWPDDGGPTQFTFDYPKKAINKIFSPDVHMDYSVNPYQGCEHGCIYCYARNSHQYWGLDAGLDFEQQIIVKPDIATLVEKEIHAPGWQVAPISLSGNTDCYQPAERKFALTRSILQIMATYRHPVGIITKNQLITRDLDLLQDLNRDGLVHVAISITTLDEKLRQVMEPRTAAVNSRFNTVARLAAAGIPVRIMVAPIIPGLTDHDIAGIIARGAEAGASAFGYTVARLNGAISRLFAHWLTLHFPDRKNKVLHAIADCHDGRLNDSQWGRRMKGSGPRADMIRQLFYAAIKKHGKGTELPPLNLNAFRSKHGSQGALFEV